MIILFKSTSGNPVAVETDNVLLCDRSNTGNTTIYFSHIVDATVKGDVEEVTAQLNAARSGPKGAVRVTRPGQKKRPYTGIQRRY